MKNLFNYIVKLNDTGVSLSEGLLIFAGLLTSSTVLIFVLENVIK